MVATLALCSPAHAALEGDLAAHRLADAVAAALGIVPPTETILNVTQPSFPAPAPYDEIFHRPGQQPAPRSAPGGGVHLSVRCPARLLGRRVAVYHVSSGSDIEAERFRCPKSTETPVDVPLRTVTEADSVVAAIQDLGPHRVKTPPIRLPQGAVLRTAVGLQQFGPLERAGRPRLRVVARNAAGRTVTVLDHRPDAARPEDRGWADLRVDLEPVRATLGSPVRLSFEAQPDEGAGLPVYPVWGDPTIVWPRGGGPGETPPWNVVLVSLDTLRADRLGCYGHPRQTSPVLDRLATEGTRFDTVIAPSSWTLPSHATMLTGLYYCVHRLSGKPGRPLPPAAVPLAEHLRAAGYATAAVTEDIFFDPAAFLRGFGFYRENRALDNPDRMPDTIGFATDWLRRQASTPFFLLVHTYQTHEPYFAPPGVRASFNLGPELLGGGAPREQLLAQYDAAVAYTDASLPPLLDTLDALGLRDRTIVIVTSDHGEAFGEHGYTGHGRSLHEEILRVPMIWRAPGLVGAGRRVTGQVGLVDVTPTLLDLLGLPPRTRLQGISLAPLLRAGGPAAAPAGRVLFSENALEFYRLGARWEHWKALQERGTTQIFDLRRDPGERSPEAPVSRVAEAASAATAFEADCSGVRGELERAGAGRPSAPVIPPDAETLRRLRALGYVVPEQGETR